MIDPIPPLIVILGQTATGKTDLSLELARRIDVEVIGADSRQVYRGMDIGTAKPPLDVRRCVPHHLIDVVDPDEPFGLSDFSIRAQEAIDSIRGRDRLPLLVGGSGQYLWAIIEGWNVPRVAPNIRLRESLQARELLEGSGTLHAELKKVDPAAAQAIHPNNVRRVIRALELLAETGEQPSNLRRRRSPRSDAIVVGLQIEREELHTRINQRVDEMFQGGFVSEVEGLLGDGYNESLPSMSGIGYTQVVHFLRGELELADTVDQVKTATHHFARQQAVWFRPGDGRIAWIRPGDIDALMRQVSGRQLFRTN